MVGDMTVFIEVTGTMRGETAVTGNDVTGAN